MKYDFTMARRANTNAPYEQIVDTDYPTNENGSPAGPDDMFKLEFSGWVRHVEFKPKDAEK